MTLQQLKYVLLIAKHGTLSKAANEAFISQPSLSQSLKELEEEIGVQLFYRSNKGLTVSAAGDEFLAYARQIVEQYQMVEDKYINKNVAKNYFGVSAQHYSFATKAFIETVKKYNDLDYEFAIRETKTHSVMDDVKSLRSEIGILYLSHYNRRVLTRLFNEYKLDFVPLFSCPIYVFVHKDNPIAKLKNVTLEELHDLPCFSFEQGIHNSFFFSEDVLSTNNHKQIIGVNDRATMLNLMEGLQGFTLCAGVLAEELNGSDYTAIPLVCDDLMEIGYIHKKDIPLSDLAKTYIEEVMKVYNERYSI